MRARLCVRVCVRVRECVCVCMCVCARAFSSSSFFFFFCLLAQFYEFPESIPNGRVTSLRSETTARLPLPVAGTGNEVQGDADDHLQ